MDKFNNDSVDKSLLSHSDSETNKVINAYLILPKRSRVLLV